MDKGENVKRANRAKRKSDNWVLCDRCDAWCFLPPDADTRSLPKKWYCNDCLDDVPSSAATPTQPVESPSKKREMNEGETDDSVFDCDGMGGPPSKRVRYSDVEMVRDANDLSLIHI